MDYAVTLVSDYGTDIKFMYVMAIIMSSRENG